MPSEPSARRQPAAEDEFLAVEEPITVYELELEDDGSPSKERSYIRLPAPYKPYVVRISIDAGSRASKAGVLCTNFPLDGSAFERSNFHKRPLPSDTSKPIHVEIPITKAGAFEFFVEHDASAELGLNEQLGDGGATKGKRVKSKSCYINVDPVLEVPERSRILTKSAFETKGSLPSISPVGKGGKVLKSKVPLPLDGLVIQSIIAKWMGSLTEWPAHLDVTRDRGYNMIHFTPLQQRGQSGSPYSIYDQLLFDDALFDDKKATKAEREKQMEKWLARIRDEWGMLSMTDVVFNHTADNSPWLQDHPEAGYNIVNSPHLGPALELDTALLELSDSLTTRGLPTVLKTAADLDKIAEALRSDVLPKLRLWEFYAVDVKAAQASFLQAWKAGKSAGPGSVSWQSLSSNDRATEFPKHCLVVGWDLMGPRHHATIQADAAVGAVEAIMGKKSGSTDSADEALNVLGQIINDVNVNRYKEYDEDVKTIIENTINRIRYTRLDDHGPKMGEVTKTSPLIESLFTRLPKNKRTAVHDQNSLSLANNGWIWNANPLQDFASIESRAYLRREVIVWGDCVKLRYGASPSDNPFLWDHMTNYTQMLAKMFAGFRIDNCHSTPIHVGEVLLDAARRVNPNLYVCAELFTGSEEMDTYFVSRLGINSLIREAMNGHDPKDQSRLLYQYGLRKPIGSMDGDVLTERTTINLAGKARSAFVIPLQGSKPHAFFMDCTHDNESPSLKRTARDALPTGALVAFSNAAVGSNKGFDDLYPKLLNLVTDKRHYETYKTPESSGIGSWKRLLNHLHTEMVLDGFEEGHFHQENDYIITHRINPRTHQGYLLVAHTAFSGTGTDRGQISSMQLRGTKARLLMGATLKVPSQDDPADSKIFKGLPSTLETIAETAIQEGSDDNGPFVEIVVPDKFPPASVMLFSTWMEGLDPKLDELCTSGATEAFAKLDFVELNIVIFRTDGEERDATAGQDGVYTIPDLGPLKYCGLEGWMHPLRHVVKHNDLGHPLCSHLRNGSWALEFIANRLLKQASLHPGLNDAAQWFKKRNDAIAATIPAFLRPRYFSLVIYTAYKAARRRFIEQCSPFVQQGTQFVHSLALTSIQMYGLVSSASLDPEKKIPCVAAGLPHFSSGWARTWGRDCAISASGLFIKTGMHEAARDHLLCFCTTIKHGLMPNLLDSVKTPRYNSRDSPWFMLQLLQDYVKETKEGESFLNVKVKRRFPSNDEWVAWNDAKAYCESLTVGEVVHEILQRHASGIHFREYNAGPNIDGQMSDLGFNIDIDVDWETGLILGGNEKNCGTWMDKMGESQNAGSKGFPGTPRDGAPVEITGLLYSTLVWASQLAKKGVLKTKGVKAKVKGSEKQVSYQEWADLIKKSFEECYFVPIEPADRAKYRIKPELIGRVGIYKDVYGTPQGRDRADYQLRCNFPIAMTVAPDLFDPEHALQALHQAHNILLGPLGMRTLDPADVDYRPYYDNANDSNDWHVAKGRNYHQGPEWVWPLGYFLRAYLYFDLKVGAGKSDRDETLHHIHSLLAQHRRHIQQDAWAGLPELTNKDGEHCRDSCETQAWSSSTLLDALEAIYRMQDPKPFVTKK